MGLTQKLRQHAREGPAPAMGVCLSCGCCDTLLGFDLSTLERREETRCHPGRQANTQFLRAKWKIVKGSILPILVWSHLTRLGTETVPPRASAARIACSWPDGWQPPLSNSNLQEAFPAAYF